MKMNTRIAICSLGTLALGLTFVATSSAAHLLIDDDLNSDTSANSPRFSWETPPMLASSGRSTTAELLGLLPTQPMRRPPA